MSNNKLHRNARRDAGGIELILLFVVVVLICIGVFYAYNSRKQETIQQSGSSSWKNDTDPVTPGGKPFHPNN